MLAAGNGTATTPYDDQHAMGGVVSLSQGERLRSTSSASGWSTPVQLDQRVRPQVQVPGPNVEASKFTQLLLASAPHFLHVLERLFQAVTIGHHLQDLRWRRVRIGAEKRHPPIFLFHQHHPNLTPRVSEYAKRSCRFSSPSSHTRPSLRFANLCRWPARLGKLITSLAVLRFGAAFPLAGCGPGKLRKAASLRSRPTSRESFCGRRLSG